MRCCRWWEEHHKEKLEKGRGGEGEGEEEEENIEG
jgi:hypothetical protein